MNVRWLVGLSVLGAMGCDGGGEPTRTEDILALTGAAAGGETVYQTNCAVCHGADGAGGVGADLTTTVPTLGDEAIVDTVLDGTTGMQPFDNLSDQAIADVLAYLRQEHG